MGGFTPDERSIAYAKALDLHNKVFRILDILQQIQNQFVALVQQVEQNVNGAFNNPEDLQALNALIDMLILAIQNFAASLPPP